MYQSEITVNCKENSSETNLLWSVRYSRYSWEIRIQIIDMSTIIKASTLAVVVLAIYGNQIFVNGMPVDAYDEYMGNDDKLFLRMMELIDSIGSDDDDSSSRYQSVESKSGQKASEKCLLPMRKGVCRALIPRWSYDPIAKECKEFKFGGCDGNGNNFSSEKSCMETCEGM